MNEYGALFNIAKSNVTDQIQQLVNDFPLKSPDSVPDIAAILTNFGGVLSLVSGLGGSELQQTLTGTVGGIFSQVGGLVDTASDDDTTETALYTRSSAVYTAVYDSISQALINIFEDGDLSTWPSSLTNGDYVHKIANFFDGRFMYQLQGSDETQIEKVLNQNLLATLAGTALLAANYYILKGAHTTSDCADVTSGVLIDGYCYTLEYPGAGWSVSEQNDFSDQIANDDLKKLTETYFVTLEDLYSNSYECQNSTGGYGGTMVVDLVLEVNTELPSCFYNLPVFTVDASDTNVISSPCLVLNNNETTDTQELGVTYMPSNLADIFDDDFCFCTGGSRECSE
ncbi:hypothetical protein N7490_002884 [Penicillium lividum]|nr:hypothetical protein N7490_002884 [Penicillium lividum]